MFLSKLKKFDVHLKTVDGVSQQTLLGAFFTLLTFGITVILLYSEIKFYMTRENIYHMTIDQNIGKETVRLDFDVDFHGIKCNGITSSSFLL